MRQYRPNMFVIYLFSYNDAEGFYSADLALVELSDYIRFRSHIKPICWEITSAIDIHVESHSMGEVAGWGAEEAGGATAPELKVATLSTLSTHDCRNAVDAAFKPFVTGDKFCAGSNYSSNVCNGDSGGGLVFKKTEDGVERHYIRGIVSNGPSKLGGCNRNHYTAFTTIHYYQSYVNYWFNLTSPINS